MILKWSLQQKGEDKMEKRVLCFGDSNTWGFNAKTEDRFSRDIRWTRKLQKALGEDYEIIEEGLNGRNAVCEDQLKEGLKGIDYIYPCIMTHKPLDLVLIKLGTNDAKERYSMTPHNIAMGIIRLANKVKNNGTGINGNDPEILIVAPAPIGKDYMHCDAYLSMGKEADRKSVDMVPYLKAMAEENGFHFLDAGRFLSMGETDHMHLDEEGHDKMASILNDKIREIFNQKEMG